jgi:hypothetical protein
MEMQQASSGRAKVSSASAWTPSDETAVVDASRIFA